MKKNIIYLAVALTILAIQSCNVNKNNIIGKYNNSYEADAIHFVELKKDSSFLHYYKKNSNQPKENKGVWRLISKNGKDEIMFDTWIDYGYIDKPICNGCINFVQLKNGELIFNFDLPRETNFIKE